MNIGAQVAGGIPVSLIDFYSDETIRTPYPVYEELRALGAVVYLEKHDLYALPGIAKLLAGFDQAMSVP